VRRFVGSVPAGEDDEEDDRGNSDRRQRTQQLRANGHLHDIRRVLVKQITVSGLRDHRERPRASLTV